MPVYESIARVDINPSQSTDIGISDLMENKIGSDTSNRLLTQVRILQSDSVIYAVIESQNLYTKKPFSEVFKEFTLRSRKTAHPRPARLAAEQAPLEPAGHVDSQYRPG